MHSGDDVEELGRHPALAGLGEAALVALAARGRRVSVPAGELLAGDGRPAPAGLIEEGVAWHLRHGRRVTRLGPGDLFGVGWTGRWPPSAEVVAATPMRLLLLPGLDRALASPPATPGQGRSTEQVAG